MKAERWLVLALRLSAFCLLLAIAAVFMPFAWMDYLHRQLGLGSLPDVPILHYLTRSASALYAGYGAVLALLSLDVRRYRPVIVLQAVLGLVFGVTMLVIDLTAGMPAHWTWAEGPFVFLLSWVILGLVWKARLSAE